MNLTFEYLPKVIWQHVNDSATKLLYDEKLKKYADCKYNSVDHLHLIYGKVCEKVIMDVIIDTMDSIPEVKDFIYSEKYYGDILKSARTLSDYLIKHFRG